MGTMLDAESSPIRDLRRRRVVVIEDTVDNVELIFTLLREDVGVGTVLSWASGAMFFRWFQTAPSVQLNPHYRQIDLILLDLHIPREDGFAVLRQIRATPELARTPVVAVTAQASALTSCQEVGFNGFLAKPLRPAVFPSQVRRLLAGEAIWDEWRI